MMIFVNLIDFLIRFLPTWSSIVENSVWAEKNADGDFNLIRLDAPNLIVSMDEKCHSPNEEQNM